MADDNDQVYSLQTAREARDQRDRNANALRGVRPQRTPSTSAKPAPKRPLLYRIGRIRIPLWLINFVGISVATFFMVGTVAILVHIGDHIGEKMGDAYGFCGFVGSVFIVLGFMWTIWRMKDK